MRLIVKTTRKSQFFIIFIVVYSLARVLGWDGHGPDPKLAYFWPVINESPTCLWPRYFWTWYDEIFWPEGKKLVFLRGNFTNPEDSGHKFDPDPSLVFGSLNCWSVFYHFFLWFTPGKSQTWGSQDRNLAWNHITLSWLPFEHG